MKATSKTINRMMLLARAMKQTSWWQMKNVMWKTGKKCTMKLEVMLVVKIQFMMLTRQTLRGGVKKTSRS